MSCHDQRSMSNSSISYGIHKVTPDHCQKGQEKVKVKPTDLVLNFIIQLTVEGQSQMVQ